MKLIQVSDLHFVPPGTRLYGLDPRARLDAAIADINARHPDAELCLFTGDLTDSGAPEAYTSLRESLAALRLPYRLLIGNHDEREAFRRTFPETPCDENGFVQSIVQTPTGVLILLDTNLPGTDAGYYCAARQAWLRKALRESAGKPVYIFLHHPPFDIGIPRLDRVGLLEPEGFAAAIRDNPPRHIFFGHVHRPVSGSWRGIPFSALRSTVHQVPLDFAAKPSLPDLFEPPNYNVILISPETTLVHHHDFLACETIPADAERYSAAE